jgi:hypothetical protein
MTDCNIAQIIETYEITGVLAFPASEVAHVSENAEDVGDWTHGGTLDAAIQQSVIRVSQGETAAISGVRKSSGEAVDLLFTDNTVSIVLGYKATPDLYPDWNELCAEFIRPLDKPNAIDLYTLYLH